MTKHAVLFAIGWCPGEVIMPPKPHVFRFRPPKKGRFAVPYQKIMIDNNRKSVDAVAQQLIKQIREWRDTVKLVGTFDGDLRRKL
jgi:hypothetical protein